MTKKLFARFIGLLTICALVCGCEDTSSQTEQSVSEKTEVASDAGDDKDDSRKQREASGLYPVTLGIYQIELSDYWEQSSDNSYEVSSENDDVMVTLTLNSSFDSADPVGYEWYDTEEERTKLIDTYFTSMWFTGFRNLTLVETELIEDCDEKGVLWTYQGDYKSRPLKGYMYIEKDFKQTLMTIPEFGKWLQTKGSLMNGSVR